MVGGERLYCIAVLAVLAVLAVHPDLLLQQASMLASGARRRAHAATPARMSVRMRTRLYAALVKLKIQPTFSCPR